MDRLLLLIFQPKIKKNSSKRSEPLPQRDNPGGSACVDKGLRQAGQDFGHPALINIAGGVALDWRSRKNSPAARPPPGYPGVTLRTLIAISWT